MASIDASSKTEIFRYDQPLVIAMNRQTAILIGVRLRYQANGYKAGTVLAVNSNDSLSQAYSDAGSSGINVATSILLDPKAPEDFNGTAATSTALAVAIYGGCVVYHDNLTGIDAAAIVDFKGTKFTDLSGTVLLKF